jgi:hypothetical protein
MLLQQRRPDQPILAGRLLPDQPMLAGLLREMAEITS